ncbi:MAG TPA: hypothetical protein VIM53_02595 [Candidatus Saccharimonadales bacterium]
MNKAVRLVTTGALATGIGLGVSACGPAGTPALETPNNTLEVAANNINYWQTVGSLPASQTIKITLPANASTNTPAENLDIWNLTSSKVNPAQVKAAANYLVTRVADISRVWNLPMLHNADASAAAGQEKEHDMILVPNGTPSPANGYFMPGISGTTSHTSTLESKSETVSVVYQSLDETGSPQQFLGKGSDHALSVEMCQALIDVVAEDGSNLAQETICNSEGREIDEIEAGKTYQQYVQDIAAVSVETVGDSRTIELFTDSSQGYAQATQALLGK